MSLSKISQYSKRPIFPSILIIWVFFFAPSGSSTTDAKIDFSPTSMLELLAANFALHRDDREAALSYFASQNDQHRVASIAEQTTHLAFTEKQYDVMLKAAQTWIEISPDTGSAYFYAALAAAFNGKSDQAFSHMEKADSLKHPTDYTRIITILKHQLPPPVNYISRLEEKREIAPSNVDIYIALSQLYQHIGKIDRIPTLLVQALNVGKHNPATYLFAGNIYESIEQPEQALNTYQNGVFLYPTQIALRLALAKLALKIDPSLAKIQFDILNLYSPNNAFIKKQLGLIFIKDNDLNRAELIFHQLAALPNSKPFAKTKLAHIATLKNQPKIALRHLQAIPQSYQTPSNHIEMIKLHTQLKQWKSAKKRIKQQLKISTTDNNRIQIKMLHIRLLNAMGKHHKALKLLKVYYNEHPSHTEFLITSAIVSAKHQTPKKFIRHLKALLQNTNNTTQFLQQFGKRLTSNNTDPIIIKRILLLTLSLTPNNPILLDSYGWLLYGMGLPLQAKAWISRSFEIAPIAETAAHLGEVLLKLGEKDSAKQIFDQAFKLKPDNQELQHTIERFHAT